MDIELPLNIDLLSSRMAVALARLIEATEDVVLLPIVGTSVGQKKPEYSEYITDFEFTIMSGTYNSFDIMVQDGNIKRNAYCCHLTEKNLFRRGMRHIVESFLPPTSVTVEFEVRVEVGVNINAWLRWRIPPYPAGDILLVHNQIADPSKVKTTWNNLRFRSHSEMRIAVALDKAGVFFLPNCMGRLSIPAGRKNLECDFLVICDGKVGILEVDGEPYHPATRAAQDHERDRLFKAHGIRVVERFDARECYENAQGVVQKFLDILRKL